MKELDLRDLACPGPVLELRELLDAGERELRFRVADELLRRLPAAAVVGRVVDGEAGWVRLKS